MRKSPKSKDTKEERMIDDIETKTHVISSLDKRGKLLLLLILVCTYFFRVLHHSTL